MPEATQAVGKSEHGRIRAAPFLADDPHEGIRHPSTVMHLGVQNRRLSLDDLAPEQRSDAQPATLPLVVSDWEPVSDARSVR